jgi:hypothetical protein
MAQENELVTVFRSADPDAEDQAVAVRDMLANANIEAELFDDTAPGVPEGAREVRVSAQQAEVAERLVNDQKDPTPSPGDVSHNLDMVTLFATDAADGELVTLGIRSILDAQDIPSVLISGPMFPSLPFEVRVPKSRLEEARRAIAAAEEAGPSAAEEGELESEESGGSGQVP